MEFEAAYDPDGSVAAWLCYRLDRYVGSVSRTGPGRWQANDADGAIIGIGRTRKEALTFVSRQPSADSQPDT